MCGATTRSNAEAVLGS